MEMRLRNSLLNEEERTVKWFLWLFYSVYFLYDLIYFHVLPYFLWESQPGLPNGSLGYFMYIVMIGLLPIAYYLIKNNKPHVIKYVYFLVFTTLNVINDIWYYWGSEIPYSSGNVIELVIVLFAPIFVNKQFFYVVSLGTIFKFLFVGLIIQDPVVLLPLLMVIVLSMIAYILLHRFFAYVNAVKGSYDKQLEGIVKGVIATIELKDPYTRGHSERVAEYAQILAKATGKYTEEELKPFYYVCLLHDIGKVNIPDSILTKPGRLTDEEFEIIKTHPKVGAKAVQQVEGVQDHIDVITYHHERWDGTGYPEQLKAEQIPFLARVTAIADAFDAMTSSRSYRAALPIEEAYRRIMEGKESQFDPGLVNLFNEIFSSWADYHDKYHSREEVKESSAKIKRG